MSDNRVSVPQLQGLCSTALAWEAPGTHKVLKEHWSACINACVENCNTVFFVKQVGYLGIIWADY